LTLLYGALFMCAGAVLLVITYELVAHSDAANRGVAVRARLPGGPGPQKPSPGATVFFQQATGQLPIPKLPPDVPVQVRDTANRLQAEATAQLAAQRQAQLDALLTKSGVALAIMAVVSIGLGWLMAGRALRPVRTMSQRARGISERNLHERLGVQGPDDELKELGDTFDALLARLESAFESQRRFVANASHELRTPITLERTLVEVALADPHANVDSLRQTCQRVLAASEQQERLIEALLTLARSQRGLTCREELDLAELGVEVMRSIDPEGLRVEADFEEATVVGDRALLERLVANLLDNAVRYNREGGELAVRTGVVNGRPGLRISNTGAPISPDEVSQLVEPFRRLDGERTGHPDGLGLGLSIVAAIAEVHDAQLVTEARPGGGLTVQVAFAPAAEPLVSARGEGDLVTLR